MPPLFQSSSPPPPFAPPDGTLTASTYNTLTQSFVESPGVRAATLLRRLSATQIRAPPFADDIPFSVESPPRVATTGGNEGVSTSNTHGFQLFNSPHCPDATLTLARMGSESASSSSSLKEDALKMESV